MANSDLVLRPSVAEIGRRAKLVLPVEACLIGIGVVRVLAATRSSSLGRIAAFAVMAVILLGTIGLTIAYARIARVVVSTSAVCHQNVLRTRSFPRSEIQLALRWTDVSFGNRPSDRLILTGTQGRLPFVLDSALWSQEVLTQLGRELAVPVETYPDAKSAAAAHPSTLPFRDAHPVGLVLLGTAALMLVLFLGVLAFQVTTAR